MPGHRPVIRSQRTVLPNGGHENYPSIIRAGPPPFRNSRPRQTPAAYRRFACAMLYKTGLASITIGRVSPLWLDERTTAMFRSAGGSYTIDSTASAHRRRRPAVLIVDACRRMLGVLDANRVIWQFSKYQSKLKLGDRQSDSTQHIRAALAPCVCGT